ncbi:MAG: MopE-related protein, partial [Phycisphaerales bacterium]
NPAGTTVCSATAGTAATEVCDALDNDCDGSTDETHPDKGTVCTSGVGACGRVGVKICNASAPGGATICNATAGTAVTEICNTLDDDCDGATDDGWLNGGKYDQNTACGNCSTDCTAIFNKANAFGVCNAVAAPTCVLTCCKPGDVNPACSGQTYFDLNAVPGDGCEFLLDTTAIYVSSSDLTANDTAGCGRGPTGTGAGNRPCLSIARGLAEAVSTGRTKVLVAGGAYYEAVTLVAGKSLLGGHNPTTWSRDITSNTTAIFGNTGSGNRKAVTAKDIQSGATLLEGFTIYGENATGSGQNSYALWVSNCGSALTVRNNIIWGGYGGPGANGASGASGASGTNGASGKNAYQPAGAYNCYENCIGKGAENVGGAGGSLSCGGVSAAGGAGGQAGCPDWDEGQNLCNVCPVAPNNQTLSAGSGATGAGGGGTGGAGGCDSITDQECADPNCACRTPNDPACVNGGTPSVGENGPSGINGTGGAGAASGAGTVVSGEWVGTSGAAGVAGTAGKGGGGGGAGGGVEGYASAGCASNGATDIGGSGGGGGSGGCGAASGSAGSAGGGSFAIFVTFPSAPTTVPTFTSNELNRGFGGIGGDGGSGGTGGSGGNGGVGGGGGTLG